MSKQEEPEKKPLIEGQKDMLRKIRDCETRNTR